LLNFASQEEVVLAFIEDQRIFDYASLAGIVTVVLFAVFDTYCAGSA
jgi:hypothetical protein